MPSGEKAERIRQGTAPAPDEEPVEDASEANEKEAEQEKESTE